MIIEHDGKQFNTDTWHKDYLEKLLSKQLEKVIKEKESLQAKHDLTYMNLIFELSNKEKDLKYKLAQVKGQPML